MTSYVKIPIRRGFEQIDWLLDLLAGLPFVVAGGFARYCATPQHIPLGATQRGQQPDIDLFPYQAGAAAAMIERLVDHGLTVKHASDYATTFSWPYEELRMGGSFAPDIQIIHWHRDWHSAEDILDSFDFANSAVALMGCYALAHPLFEEAEEHDTLRIVAIDDPVRCLKRVMKYARKGYDVPYTELARLFLEWDRRSPAYRARVAAVFEDNVFAELDIADKVDLYTTFSVEADIEPVGKLEPELPF
ncbi:hypothetical protein [Aggregatilinea lenta]|uniref:hypothetical protein n=1 Tax=Aggregatilinea lenta TaxID=913108 RepID=UPI000E5AC1F4|nr:hypothetical protein [Aggregatilinea lenta]